MVTYTTPQTDEDDDDDNDDELWRVTFVHPYDPTATPTSTPWRATSLTRNPCCCWLVPTPTTLRLFRQANVRDDDRPHTQK